MSQRFPQRFRRAATAAVAVLVVLGTPQAGADEPSAEADRPDAAGSAPATPSTGPHAEGSVSDEPQGPQAVELDELGERAPVGRIVHTIEPATERRFSFYVPKAYDPDRRWPLLVECTGTGIGRDNVEALWPLAEEHGLIVASADTWAVRGEPTETIDAWTRNGRKRMPVNVRGAHQVLPDLAADEKAILGLVHELKARYAIDESLVVLAGYSGGAWTAYYVGVGNPKVFAGVAVRSGNFYRGFMPRATPPARRMPVTVVIGEKDLEMVLDDTAKAEQWFAENEFEQFQVERLPNSGHDSRPEAAANFVGHLRSVRDEARLRQATERWRKFLRAGEALLSEGETARARGWLEKAADLEREFDAIEPKATRRLKELDEAAGTSSQHPRASD